MSTLREAFFTVISDAKQPTSNYVSLYCKIPYYGGPEEGGWWGSDTVLIAYQEYSTPEAASSAEFCVKELTKEMNAESRKNFGEHCLRTTEWLDERGLDADFLPEVDGEESYFVVIEQQVGSMESRGCRHYE